MSKKQLIIKLDDTPASDTLLAGFDEKARRGLSGQQE